MIILKLLKCYIDYGYKLPIAANHFYSILGKLSNRKSGDTWELLQSGDDTPTLTSNSDWFEVEWPPKIFFETSWIWKILVQNESIWVKQWYIWPCLVQQLIKPSVFGPHTLLDFWVTVASHIAWKTTAPQDVHHCNSLLWGVSDLTQNL